MSITCRSTAPPSAILALRVEGAGMQSSHHHSVSSEAGGPTAPGVTGIVSSCCEMDSLDFSPLFTWPATPSLWDQSNKLTSCVFQLFLLQASQWQ